MNKFRVDEPVSFKIQKVDPNIEKEQIKRLERVRKERDNEKVKADLKRIRECAEGKENLMPPILEAVKDYATIGEICGVLREVFGEYKAFALAI